ERRIRCVLRARLQSRPIQSRANQTLPRHVAHGACCPSPLRSRVLRHLASTLESNQQLPSIVATTSAFAGPEPEIGCIRVRSKELGRHAHRSEERSRPCRTNAEYS